MSTLYKVFVRNWYKRENGRVVPNPGARKTTLASGLSYEGARDMCQVYNANHKPGPLSRKAEFTAA